MTGKSLVLSALALKAKEDENLNVGFVSQSKLNETYFNDAVQRFCKENNMKMLTDEEQAPLQNFFSISRKESARIDDDVTLTHALTKLALKYDCLFIDEILLESYHSHWKTSNIILKMSNNILGSRNVPKYIS